MSKSLLQFRNNLDDFNRLMAIHSHIGGAKPGRRYDLEVLNKAAIILICASWESYCEDLLFEQLQRLSQRDVSHLAIPTELRATIGKRIKQDLDHRSPWRLAGAGWRTELSTMTEELRAAQNFLNTSKTGRVDDLFSTYLGLASLSSHWHWPGMSVKQACKKLDDFVKLRGEIVHRVRALGTVKRKQPEDFAAFAKRVVNITERTVMAYVRSLKPRIRLPRKPKRRSKWWNRL